MCSVQGWPHWPQGRHIGRTGGCLGPFMRRLTPQVVVQAGRPHCHLSGPAAQERVTTTSKRAHRPTRAQSQARAQNHGVNVQTLPTRRREQMPPPSIPTFPHQKAKKSRHQQQAVSYNPYNPSFPRDKAEKSRSQQHDLSILIVGSNQLKHRLSRARKPKSHSSSNMKCPITRASRINMMKSRYKTNTFCPITLKLAPTNFNTDFSAPASRIVTLPATRSVL